MEVVGNSQWYEYLEVSGYEIQAGHHNLTILQIMKENLF